MNRRLVGAFGITVIIIAISWILATPLAEAPTPTPSLITEQVRLVDPAAATVWARLERDPATVIRMVEPRPSPPPAS